MTTRDRHSQVKEIFASACLRNTSERLDYLVEACGEDEELRREIESLLEFHDGAPTELGRKANLKVFPDREPPPTKPGPTQTSVSKSSSRSSGLSATRATGRFNPGELFAKRYRIVSLLGVGGMGEVYQAHDEVLDVPVALKFIIESNEERRENLLNEVRLARRVTHPSVCRVFDVGQVGQEYFITMEYVDGENMASLLRRVGRFPGDKMLELAHQLCAGLHAAHAQGVLHQDLKPANILINNEGKVRITDFGIATTTESSSNDQIVGTPAYMAPERLAGQSASVQSDLYALGLVLYEMASGKAVFTASTPFEYAALHRSQVPEAPTQHTPELDKKVETAILQCLEKDPRNRPKSVLELIAALPGGDPLKMAMEAGETPPPELLARLRGSDEGLHPGAVAAIFCALMAALVGLFLIAGKAYHLPGPDELKPPVVLAEKAREISRDLGHDDTSSEEFGEVAPSSRAWGFLFDVNPERKSVVQFWYRQSPYPLIPSDGLRLILDDPRIDFEDPPHLIEGMSQMILDAQGRLMMFYIIPPILEEDQPPAVDGEPDWDVVLRAGGYDPGEVQVAEEGPRRVPRIYVDERRSWTGVDPRGASADATGDPPRVHIDVASHRGRVVYFSAWPAEPEDVADEETGLFEYLASLIFFDIGWLLVGCVAIFIAVANLRRGRGDLRGARNLVFFVVGVKIVHWLLMAPHVPFLDDELISFHGSLGVALVEALVVWLAYIALEPTVRRYWPRTLIAWSRLLRGRSRDALVGQGLLVGSLVGTLWALLRAADHLLVDGFQLSSLPEGHTVWQLDTAFSVLMPLGNLLTNSLYSIYAGILWLFVLAIFRVLSRQARVAVAGFVTVQVLNEMLTEGHPEIYWMTLGLVVAGTAAWTLVRFGLLPYIVALFVESVLTSSPVTSDLSAWFSGAGIFALLVPLLLAGYGAWSALGGRRLVGDWLVAEA